jgi:hypothetical protein
MVFRYIVASVLFGESIEDTMAAVVVVSTIKYYLDLHNKRKINFDSTNTNSLA